MMAVTIAAFVMSIVGRNLTRYEGIVLVAAYVAATALLASLAADPDELDDDEAAPFELVARSGPGPPD